MVLTVLDQVAMIDLQLRPCLMVNIWAPVFWTGKP